MMIEVLKSKIHCARVTEPTSIIWGALRLTRI
jgi:hypothetical protein